MSDIIDFDLTKGGPRRRRRKPWIRATLVRAGWISLLLLVACRLTLSLWLPPALRKLGHNLGLELTYEQLDLTLLGGRVTLRGVRAQTSGADPSAAPLAALDYAVLDIAVASLLRGELRIHRAEVDGGSLSLTRDAAGVWNTSQLWTKLGGENQPSKPWFERSKWNDLRLQDLTVLLVDATQTPIEELRAKVDLTLADLGFEDRPARMEIRARADGQLDGLLADATLFAKGPNLEATSQVEMFGLRHGLAQRLLAPFGLQTDAQTHGLRFQLQTNLERCGDDLSFVQGPLFVHDLALQADHSPGLIIEQLKTTLAPSRGLEWEFGPTQSQGVEIHTHRSHAGVWSLAGLTQTNPDPNRAAAWAPALKRCKLGPLDFEGVRWVLEDATTEPKSRVDLQAAGSVLGFHFDATNGWQTLEWSATAQAAGLCEAATLKGRLHPGSQGSLDLSVSASGVQTGSLQGYLTPLGLNSTLQDARLEAHTVADWTFAPGLVEWNFALRDAWVEQNSERSSIQNLSLERVAHEQGQIRVGAVHLEGSELRLGRDGLGNFDLAGLAHGSPSQATRTWEWPKVLLVHELTLHNVQWELFDAYPAEAAWQQSCRLDDVRLSAWKREQVGASVALEGAWNGRLGLPGLAADLTSQGQFQSPQPNAEGLWRADMELHDLGFSPLRGWLEARGLQADWRGADAKAAASGTWQWGPSGPYGTLEVHDVELAQGEQSWLKIASIELDAWRWQDQRWSTDQVRVSEPVVPVERRTNGDLAALGVHWPSTSGALAWQQLQAASLADWPLQTLSIVGARVPLRDDSMASESSEWTIGMLWSKLAAGTGAPGWRLETQLGIPGTVERASLKGEWRSANEVRDFQFELEANGLQSNRWPDLFDGSFELQWDQAACKAQARGSWQPLAEGGFRGQLDVPRVEWSQGDEQATLEDLTFSIDRWDPAQRVYRLGASHLGNATLGVRRDSDGRWHTVGGVWTKTHRPSAAPENSLSPTTLGPGQALEATAVRTQVPDWVAWLDGLEQAEIALGPHDWNVQKLLVRDDQIPGGPTAALSIHWTSANSWSRPSGLPTASSAYAGQVTASIDPLVDQLVLDVECDPLAQRPLLRLDWQASGLQGKNWNLWWPAAWSATRPLDLQGARSSGRLQCLVDLPGGSNRWSQGVREGFGAELTARAVNLLGNVLSEPLFALDSLEAKATSIRPMANAWNLERIQVEDPKLRTWRDALGWHAFGLTIAPNAFAARNDKSEALQDEGFVSIQRIQIDGLQWDHEDRTVEPHASFPLRNGEAEILRFSTRAQDRTLPLRLQASADAGKVRAPMRQKDGTRSEATEARNAFDHLEARARLAWGESPEGWLQMDVSGLELAPLRGWFVPLGIQLEDGLLEMRNTLRFRGDEGLAVDSRNSLENLEARGFPGSNVERELGLSQDFATTLASLRDGEGRTQIPLRFEVSRAALRPASLLTGARKAFGDLGREAALGTTGQVLEGTFATANQSELVLSLEFEPGLAQLSAESAAALADWARKQRPDPTKRWIVRQRFGPLDLERTQALSSPPPADLLELLNHLRQRKAEWAQRYVELAAEARGRLQNGEIQASLEDRAELLSLDRERAQTEQAIDQVLELLAPGSERGEDRRARAQAQALAHQRQINVLEFLRKGGFELAADAILLESAAPEPGQIADRGLVELRLQTAR